MHVHDDVEPIAEDIAAEHGRAKADPARNECAARETSGFCNPREILEPMHQVLCVSGLDHFVPAHEMVGEPL